MTKNEVRLHYRALRQELTELQKEQYSRAIAHKVLELPVWDRAYFHVFLPIMGQREVDTKFLLQLLYKKDKKIVVSRSDFETREMTHFQFADGVRLKENQYGIPEPVNGITVPVEQIQVVFVPLLAFDHSGNRVGYGKGFYDRFLAKCKTGTIKIGLSFFEAVAPWEDVFESDVKLDYCVTPEKIYPFGG